MSWILKLLAVLPELIALIKQIIDLINGSEDKTEAKAKVRSVRDHCEGVACSAETKKE